MCKSYRIHSIYCVKICLVVDKTNMHGGSHKKPYNILDANDICKEKW